MDQALLAGWENFYVIVGSSAAGLTGLTFVLIALVRDARRVQPTGLRGFVTPTIVHVGGVLALAAFLSMPHQHLLTLSLGFGVGGGAGIVYGLLTARYIGGTGKEYVPVREDWIFNVIVPTFAYAALAALAFLVWRQPALALYGVATVSLILLFVGIRNAWDIAVWMALAKPPASGAGNGRQ
jgi:hypothetical protein